MTFNFQSVELGLSLSLPPSTKLSILDSQENLLDTDLSLTRVNSSLGVVVDVQIGRSTDRIPAPERLLVLNMSLDPGMWIRIIRVKIRLD